MGPDKLYHRRVHVHAVFKIFQVLLFIIWIMPSVNFLQIFHVFAIQLWCTISQYMAYLNGKCFWLKAVLFAEEV